MSIVTSFWYFFLILLGFGALIFLHELGHFLAAKWAGIRTQAFAVGMGPVVASWRKGVGCALGSTHKKVVTRVGKAADELTDEEMARNGIGETEYSLRWLPIGGFVKMLGQEDANPNAVSDDPRSYTRCPIGKRMVVVSAGVVMNVITALVLFVIAFMVGVQFEAPVAGTVTTNTPAAVTFPSNADALGIETPGLAAGDVVRTIDGDRVLTFSDIDIAAAMARPGAAIDLVVERPGVPEPLEFSLTPEPGPLGLLAIGVRPALSSKLLGDGASEGVDDYLRTVGLFDQGVRAGMTLTAVNGQAVTMFDAFLEEVNASAGEPMMLSWLATNEEGSQPRTLTSTLDPQPRYADFVGPERELDSGLLGLTPLVKIVGFVDGSPNDGPLVEGDIVLRLATLDRPRESQFRQIVSSSKGETLPITVIRNGEVVTTEVEVSRKGFLGVAPGLAVDVPEIAQVVEATIVDPSQPEPAVLPTPAAALDLLPGTRLVAVDGRAIETWADLRSGLRLATANAHARGANARVPLTVAHPTEGQPTETLTLVLSNDDVAALHDLGWTSDLSSMVFEPVRTTLTAGGNPLTAVAMGFRQTHKMIAMTYLTIDRLFRGSVGVEQLRGPVGIIDLGAKILPRGLMYFLFFLGMISVNLAVINFLPIPIVDGGLFLFLIYEKIKGRPPSIAFQNAATFVGLFLIGAVFLVTFYNDIVRLL